MSRDPHLFSALTLNAFTLVSALGRGCVETATALRQGESGLHFLQTADGGLSAYVGQVPGLEEVVLPSALAQYDCRNNRLALMALETDNFSDMVGQFVRRVGADRIGVVMGTSTSGIAITEAAYRSSAFKTTGQLPSSFPYQQTHNVFSVADFTRRYLGLKGPAMVVSTACSSSAKAMGAASRLIESGLCSAVVVGGVDSLCDTTLYGFKSLGLLSSQPCRPFSADRAGISVGEAGGFALVCAKEDAIDQVGRMSPSIVVSGVGESVDAYHMTAPHPAGLGAQEAIKSALVRAGRQPAEVDYVHLHGTATLNNDAVEDLALIALGLIDTSVSSTKGATGHTLGAAGICGLVVTSLAMQEGWVPGTVNTHQQDPALRCAVVLTGRAQPIRCALVNTFGFGGSNCAIVLETTL